VPHVIEMQSEGGAAGAVLSGHWPLYRYDPRLAVDGGHMVLAQKDVRDRWARYEQLTRKDDPHDA
jgi:hypothetical protein